MVQVRWLPKGCKLLGRLVDCGIINCSSSGADIAEVSQVDATQMSEPAILG